MNQNEIEQLIYIFSKLPGLGQRSARRIVLHLLQDKNVRLKNLIDALTLAAIRVTECGTCGNVDISSPCSICQASNRDNKVIAVVETVAELWALERSGIFKGGYHVLGGALSAADSRNPTALKLSQLLARCKENNVSELIIATNSTLEGQTTAYFITEFFKEQSLRISRLASGIPIGGELDYLDEGTLSAAIALRQPFD